MLDGNPEPGTEVVFACELRTPLCRTARAFDAARIVRTINPQDVATPDDQFEIAFKGEHIIVRRRDITLPAHRFRAD